MSDYAITDLATVQSRLAEAKYDPTLLIEAELASIEQMTNNEVKFMSPNHPAVMLLEMSAVNTANAVQETVGLLRQAYPVLAETAEDLYRHMSDDDYLNFFASPASTKLTFAMLLSDVYNKLIYNNTERCYRAVIPRDSRFVVDGIVFTLCYPIVIRRYNNNVVQITYDISQESPIQSLKEVVIKPTVRMTANQESWMFFDIAVVQVDCNSTNFPLEKLYNFSKTIPFLDQFHYARAFYRNNATNQKWIELFTTHSEQVFDPNNPMVLFQVLENDLVVKIPVVYFSNGKLSGELRVDLYTTKGEITINLNNYTTESYSISLQPIDDENETTDEVNVFSEISFHVFSTKIVSGGNSRISFDDQRERVIYNAVGPQVLPITNIDTEVAVENDGFDLVKNIDVLTNRVFVASRKLPKPSQQKLVTSANIGIMTYIGDTNSLLASGTAKQIGQRIILPSNGLFLNNNSQLTLLTEGDRQALMALPQTTFVNEVNSKNYLYNPFHYVLDASGNRVESRAYSLDYPEGTDLSFIRQNQTLQQFVSTNSYQLKKVQNGYLLTIETNSGEYFRAEADSNVGVQLAFQPYGETAYAYINGELTGRTEANERIYQFLIETSFDLDQEDLICISNARIEGIDDYRAWIALSTPFQLFYHTSAVTTNFLADETDALLGKFLLPAGSVGNSHETLQITLGYALTHLWRRTHSFFKDTLYRTYDVDIPAYYETDTYDRDPITGAIFDIVNGEIVYKTLHRAGDPMLDLEGNPIYAHRKGDVMLDAEGNPITVVSNTTGREIDLLLVDALYYFADDDANQAYREEIAKTIQTWVTDNLQNFQDDLLEKTEIFFYPKSALASVQIQTDNNETVFISAQQTFSLVLQVPRDIYESATIRSTIEDNTTRLLDGYMGNPEINMTKIREDLKALYGDSVKGFKISGLGGDADYEVISLVNGNQALSLKKSLVIQTDKKLFVKDAVSFDFRISA